MEKYLTKQAMLHCYGKRSFLLVSLIFIVRFSSAQISSMHDKQLWLKADKAFDYGDYLGALQIYEKLYGLDSTVEEINYKLGVCSYRLNKYRTVSKKYFNKVSLDKFPESNYYLGRLSHLDKNYDAAITYFKQYKDFKSDDKEHTNSELNTLIEKVYTAKLMEATEDKTMRIANLGNTVNTEYPEYAPLIPADESFLLFTSRRKNDVHTQVDPLGDYFEDIYISKRIDSVWQKPEMLDTTINTPVHDACTGLAADGEKMLIYRTSKDLKSGDIYESSMKDNKWSTPEMLGKNVNSEEYMEASACYSPDGSMIFFSSNRPGGFGGKDLYFVKKLPNGKWGHPYNLGATINTQYDEDAPFIHPSNNILFFSSEGHKNMGGYDIFKSSYDEMGAFTEPENLGSPINTVDDDIFFVMNTDGSTGYFSSARDGGFGGQDIYSVYFKNNNVPLNVYNIHVTDEKKGVIKKVNIVVTDMDSKEIYGIYKSNEQTGKIIIISKPDKMYRIAIEAKGYEPFITNYILASDKELPFMLTKKANE